MSRSSMLEQILQAGQGGGGPQRSEEFVLPDK